MKPSCIIPCKFKSVSNMVSKHTDKFSLVPRIFSDKFEWENLITVITNSGLTLNGLTVNDYLAKWRDRYRSGEE